MPLLVAGDRAPHGDIVLGQTERSALLEESVLAEEKLDGANVGVALLPSGALEMASRGGVDTMDRGRQMGRLRAWCAERTDVWNELLTDGWVLYGEWLWRTHGVAYTRLLDFFVALDLWHPAEGFASLDDRNRRITESGLRLPPEVFQGVPGSLAPLEALLGESAYSDQPAEGLVIRPLDPEARPRAAKLVAPTWSRVTDDAWRGAGRFNQVAR